MPRTKMQRTKYKLTDFSKWLRKKMIDKDLKQADVATLINISQPQLSYKLKNNQFTLEEFIILSNYFIEKEEELKDLIIY